jgi:hypothetical protein
MSNAEGEGERGCKNGILKRGTEPYEGVFVHFVVVQNIMISSEVRHSGLKVSSSAGQTPRNATKCHKTPQNLALISW